MPDFRAIPLLCLCLGLGLEDGELRWKWDYEYPERISHPGSRAVPTVTEEVIYATSGFGHVKAIPRRCW